MRLSAVISWLTRWPVPALVTWVAAWGAHQGSLSLHGPAWLPFAAGSALGIFGTFMGSGWLQRVAIAGGFPASFAALGYGAALPVWIWLVPLVGLLVLYPVRTWGDAPLFPTPLTALDGLHRVASLAGDRSRGGARILDAGCGIGDGLKALRREYPHASIAGIEWSWPLMMICGLRCPWADIHQGDFWKVRWRDYDLVYIFQRPESMFRAMEKASREMRPGSYLVSLEFEVPGAKPVATLLSTTGRRVFVYRPATEQDPSKLHRPRALLTSPMPLDTVLDSDMIIDMDPTHPRARSGGAGTPGAPRSGGTRRELPGRSRGS